MRLGDIRLGETHDLTFETTVNGVPTTLAGVPAVAAYVDASVIELTAGLTLTVDLDGRTGLHQVRIVATAGNGYAANTNVTIVLTAGTVGGDSVAGRIVGALSIEYRSALRPGTPGVELEIESDGQAHVDVKEWRGTTPAVLSATLVQVHVGSIASAVLAAASFAAGAFDAVWSVAARVLTAATNITSTGGTTVPQTGDSFARLGLPAGASVSADLAAIEAQTDDIGTAGAGLTAVPWNAAWDAEVQSEATDALNAYDPPTRAEATTDATSILAQTAAIETDTQDLQARVPAALTAGGHMKADALALNGQTAAAANLERSASVIIRGTVDTAGLTPTVALFEADDIVEATADHYNGRIVIFTSGALTGQATDITDYALVSGRGRFTVTAMTEAPGDGDTFVIV